MLWVKVVLQLRRRAPRSARVAAERESGVPPRRGQSRRARRRCRDRATPRRWRRTPSDGSVPSTDDAGRPLDDPTVRLGAASRRSPTSSSVSEMTATVLVRRGLGDPDAARAFLAPSRPAHDPLLARRHGRRGRAHPRGGRGGRADLRARRLRRRRHLRGGARRADRCASSAPNVEWHLPSRFEEGYGVARETIERLAADGVDLVAHGRLRHHRRRRGRPRAGARARRDRHRPPPARRRASRLPDRRDAAVAPTRSPSCAAPASSTSSRGRCSAPSIRRVARTLDLVALATIADVVPLVDENRALAAAGLRALARTPTPGPAGADASRRSVDPAAVDATAVGFRLAPRINAAGRLGRPDVALELLLTDDADEADALAAKLEELNRERQARRGADPARGGRARRGLARPTRARRGYVLWGEDWHEGVIGIVASRLVERFHRPVVLIARSGDGWKGSGRSISDVRPARRRSRACSEHLERFGGHRAAAGLSIATEQLEAFADGVRRARRRGARRRRPASADRRSTRSSRPAR